MVVLAEEDPYPSPRQAVSAAKACYSLALVGFSIAVLMSAAGSGKTAAKDMGVPPGLAIAIFWICQLWLAMIEGSLQRGQQRQTLLQQCFRLFSHTLHTLFFPSLASTFFFYRSRTTTTLLLSQADRAASSDSSLSPRRSTPRPIP